MKAKRILILACIIFLFGTVTAFADSLWGRYENYNKARVYLNDTELAPSSGGVPSFIINGTTVVPLRQLAEELEATVQWNNDTLTAKIYKPNVHMFVSLDVDKDYSVKRPFGKVNHGETRNFVVSTQVDSLKAKATGFMLTIKAPNGQNAVEPLTVPLDGVNDSFWYTWPFQVNFSQKGDYTVTFSLLVDGDYTVASRKTIRSE
ncbi:hypothetical protein J31TS4_30220 [Paenibacillus sp. J31TS4]|uniref:stalk domain-containing protein n=1 Tax=Paenibacillus sp. J31TS4 TaxID=2807195 RepID=UPI001B0CBBA0|nr:stalk domain-containing protein [Paenibacillus sp. J31TS4]GIP39742.1 hypothetical protein J31TS4_30220 [Paenibacillus sp. J31TS4]